MNKHITKKNDKKSKTRRSNTTIETRHKIKGNKQLNNWQTSASVTSYIHTYLLRGWLLTHCFYGLLLRMRTHHDDASAHHTCHKWKKNNTTLASCNVFARPVQYSLQLQPSFRRPSKCLLSCWSRNKVTVWKCYDFELQAKKNGRGNDLRLVHRSTVTSLNKIKNRVWATGFW